LDWTQVAAVGGNDRAEQEMIEEDFPLTWFRWAKAEALAGEGTAEATLAAGPPRVALTVEEDLAPTGWIAAGPLRLVEPATRMINLRRNPAADLSKWVLLHGASYPADLGYRDELQQLVERNRLRYWGTVSRPKEAPDWKGDTGRVESFFDGARLADLEARLGLPPGGFTPENVVIFICGLTGTITGTIIPLIDRGFVPDFKRIREALGVPADVKDSVFYEQYDTEPVINIKDEATVAPLRARMQAGLAKQLP